MSVVINGIEYVPRLNLQPSRELGSFGEAIKACRKAQKLSLDAAAVSIGCTKSHLWNLEKGNSLPGLVMAYRMAETYGVPLLTLALCASNVPQKEMP
jgi:transcriptional regulator with XRE-family HTH domain